MNISHGINSLHNEVMKKRFLCVRFFLARFRLFSFFASFFLISYCSLIAHKLPPSNRIWKGLCTFGFGRAQRRTGRRLLEICTSAPRTIEWETNENALQTKSNFEHCGTATIPETTRHKRISRANASRHRRRCLRCDA